VLTHLFHSQTLILVSQKASKTRKASRLKNKGVEILSLPTDSKGKFPLKSVLHLLGKKGILSLLVEGGTATWTHFLTQKMAQELILFLSPKILGGDAHSTFGSLGLKKISKSSHWKLNVIEEVGEDLLLNYRFDHS
jgi:diaminohydroxyphosphoribosylaminopyrimidine deaminase/5-amino-6-(5-phosphoribosylamino)uracil reductase